MKWKIYTLNCCLLLIATIAFAQTEKVKFPYYSSKLFLQNGMELEGIILATNDSSFYLINRKDWRKIKGKERNLATLQEAMAKRGVVEWPHMEITYRSLETMETKKRKGQSNARWVGLGLGAILGIIATSFVRAISCSDEAAMCDSESGIVWGGLIMGGIGYGAGSLFSIRFPKKLLLKENEDKKWQQSLLKYSILR